MKASGLSIAMVMVCATAQALPPGITMHRAQAGELDGSGWVEAESTEGAFAVALPCKFNDFTDATRDPHDHVVKAFTVGCHRTDDIRVAVTRTQYQDGDPDAKRIFERNSSRSGKPGTEVLSGKLADMPYVEKNTQDEVTCSFERLVYVSPEIIVMYIVAPADICSVAKGIKQRFFDSLRLRKA